MMLLLMSMGKSNPVAWEKVAEGYMSGVGESKVVWWDSTYANLVPNGDEHTLIVFLGRRPTGGYSVAIDEIKSDGKRLLVVAREVCPKPGTPVIQVLTSPFVAVRVEVPDRIPLELKLRRCDRR